MKFLVKEDELNLKGIQTLYFYASWMPYHKKMLIMIDKVKEKHSNIDFLAIDVDYFKSLCKRFSVTSVPTVIILSNGTEAKRIEGLVLTSAFKSAFGDICSSIGENNAKEKNSQKDRQSN